jgi:NADPH:quinone reductase-like Zn-dependent oxidoreductase
VPCRSPAPAVPEILDLADAPEPTPGERQQLYDVSTAGINYADITGERAA